MNTNWLLCFLLGTLLLASNQAALAKAVGDACSLDADCAGKGFCIPPKSGGEGTGFVGGYCTQFDCSDDAPCATGSSCVSVQGESEDFTACFALCQAKSDCRAGYRCDNVGICVPGCSEGDCPNGMICNGEKICVDG